MCASLGGSLSGCVPPSWGANALLHPRLRSVTARPPASFQELDLAGDGVTLKAWRLTAAGPGRGTLVYLHGVADNRMSGTDAPWNEIDTWLDKLLSTR
jgi:hypothetical protein